jgi:PPOX class probable F420-dependent enzyme
MDLTAELDAFVRSARVARLATVDQQGKPHIVPVCFAYRDGVAYSVLDTKPKRVPVKDLRRVRNLRANPQVQLLVDRYDEDWLRLLYVQLRGSATVLTDGPEHAAALALLRAKYEQYQSMPLEEAPIIRIEVTRYVLWSSS